MQKIVITTVKTIEFYDEVPPGTLPKPGPMYVVNIKEMILGKINVWDVTFALPPKSAEDVVKRTLSFNAGHPALPNEVSESFGLGEAGPAVMTGRFLEGIPTIDVNLTDTDNAGNVSPVRTFPLSTVDTQAPAQPGEFGVQSVTESVIDVDDAPAPTPEPTPPQEEILGP